MLSRVRTWGSQIVICKAIVSPYSWEQQNLSLISHPQYYRVFDSILYYCGHVRVWKQFCWSYKFADHRSDRCNIPLCWPLSYFVPCGAVFDRLWATRAVWETVRFTHNLIDLLWNLPATRFWSPGVAFRGWELATALCILQREVSRPKFFLLSMDLIIFFANFQS